MQKISNQLEHVHYLYKLKIYSCRFLSQIKLEVLIHFFDLFFFSLQSFLFSLPYTLLFQEVYRQGSHRLSSLSSFFLGFLAFGSGGNSLAVFFCQEVQAVSQLFDEIEALLYYTRFKSLSRSQKE